MHTRVQKAIEPRFTEKAVRMQEKIIQTYVETLISKLNDLVVAQKDGAVVNIVSWFGFTAFNLVWGLGFGESFDYLERSEFHPWVSMIFNSLRAAVLGASLRYFPSVNWLLGLAIPKSVKEMEREHCQLAVDKINRRLNLEKTRPDLISKIKLDKEGKQELTIPELQATASVIIVAGSETTVSVLSGTTNYLVKNPDKLALMKDELRGKFSNGDPDTLNELRDLPYLNAVIQEGLILCNPIPVGLPRITPSDGATISGKFVPADTLVNVHPLTMSLSPKFFHDANNLLPERWLLSSAQDENLHSTMTIAVQCRYLGWVRDPALGNHWLGLSSGSY